MEDLAGMQPDTAQKPQFAPMQPKSPDAAFLGTEQLQSSTYTMFCVVTMVCCAALTFRAQNSSALAAKTGPGRDSKRSCSTVATWVLVYVGKATKRGLQPRASSPGSRRSVRSRLFAMPTRISLDFSSCRVPHRVCHMGQSSPYRTCHLGFVRA